MHYIILILLSSLISCAPQRHQEAETLTEYNPDGIVLHTKNALSIETSHAGIVRFITITAKNVPPRRKYILQRSDYIDTIESPLELVSDDAGRLWLADDLKIALDRYLICMNSLHLGEPCRFWLVSQNRKSAVYTMPVAYPLVTFGSDGAELTVTRLTHDGSRIRCQGKYFQSNEKLCIISLSKGKQERHPIFAVDGTFQLELAPPDKNSYGEMITLELHRQNGDCLTLNYPWGREAFNKEHLMANPANFTEEDYKKIEDAVRYFYNPYCSPERLA